MVMMTKLAMVTMIVATMMMVAAARVMVVAVGGKQPEDVKHENLSHWSSLRPGGGRGEGEEALESRGGGGGGGCRSAAVARLSRGPRSASKFSDHSLQTNITELKGDKSVSCWVALSLSLSSESELLRGCSSLSSHLAFIARST